MIEYAVSPTQVRLPESNRLLAFAGLLSSLFLVWALLSHFQENPRLDIWVLSLITVTTGLTSLLMIVFTRHWSIRSLGVLSNMMGDFALYGSSVAAYYGWFHPLGQDPLRLNLVRALFLVGCSGLLLGITLYLWHAKRRPGPTVMDDYDVPEHAA